MSDTSRLTVLGSDTTYVYDHPNAGMLETFDMTARSQVVRFETDEFTSLCPMTGQPDFASVSIAYVPDRLGVESKSLKLYLVSFRNHGAFHEDCIEQIAGDVYETIKPHLVRVVGDFSPRGGIAIKPISYRGSLDHESLIRHSDDLTFKR